MIGGAVALLAAGAACGGKGGAGQGGAVSEETKRANDALWALAPKGFTTGAVLAPRGVALFERAAARLPALAAKMQPLAFVVRALERELQWKAGDSLAERGLTSERGAALFTQGEQLVAILPVHDRDRFVAKAGGQRVGELDELGALRCKEVSAVYACATEEALLGQLGGGALGAAHAAVGSRGELEVAAQSSFGEVSLAVQLGEGTVALQGLWQHPPPAALRFFAEPERPRVDERHSGFLALDVRPWLAELPDLPILPGGLTSKALLGSVAGPVLLAGRSGPLRVELEVPLRDAAPFAELVKRCGEIPLFSGYLQAHGDTCRITLSQLTIPLAYDLWVDGKTLRLGQRDAASGAVVASTPLREALAGGAWSGAFWGRGVSFRLVPVLKVDDAEGMRHSNQQQGELLRVLSLVNELGLGARRQAVNGETALRFSGGVRTLFANPDDVVAKVLAITSDDVISGAAQARASEIAEAAPGSPFAKNLAAGNTGLVLPVGLLAATAVPAFLDYSKKAKKSEAELQLNRLSRASRIYYAEHNALPASAAPLTPSRSCCELNFEGKKKCGPDATLWQSGAWRDLEFFIEEPHYFQYTYLPSASGFVATAVGDLDCDGITVTWVLRGELRDGQLVTDLVAPPAYAD